MGVLLQFSKMESQNYIGQSERYHRQLRRIFNILKREQKTLNDKHIFRTSIKYINDTMGPNRLFRSVVVFGVLPAFLCPSTKTTNQTEIIASLHTAKAEMNKKDWKVH